MRKIFHKYMPAPETIRSHRWLGLFGETLGHPALWHLNRRSAAGAVAVGLFCGLIPGPFQMPTAALACVLLRVNLPLSLATTFYTNPLTIVPLYLIAFTLGRWVTGSSTAFTPPPGWGEQTLSAWVRQLWDWAVQLGEPLLVGLPLLAVLLAATGYFLVKLVWRWYLVRQRNRKRLA